MNHDKIDPNILVAMDEMPTAHHRDIASRRARMGIRGGATPAKPLSAVVFLHCDEDADLQHHEQHGAQVNQDRGALRTAFVRLDRMGDLSDDPAVHRIVASRSRRPLMDVAPGKVRLPAFKTRTSTSGKGVVVGIVDSGVDTRHPAFASRVLRLWDQTVPGTGVPGAKYGTELVGSAMDASKDSEGHGTHVCGIAAGSDARFSGVAPAASIVAVKTNFLDTGIADGVAYVFKVAQSLGKPAVVNLSLGGHGDGHDGADELSQMIDSLSGPGRIVCCAAGNEGDEAIHAHRTIAPGGTVTIRFKIASQQTSVLLNSWYSGAAKLRASITAPTGVKTPITDVAGGNTRVTRSVTGHRVDFTSPPKDPTSGDLHFDASITPSGRATIFGGIWRLELKNTSDSPATIDIWIADGDASFTGTSLSRASLIGSPGSSHQAITVASFTTRTEWTAKSGDGFESGLDPDTISSFSSPGPLRTGAQKPDLSAPGSMIVSALSRFSEPDDSFLIDASHVSMQGTSMACPFVAGLIACLLESDPTLDPAKAKARLQQHCRVPGHGVAFFDPKWGFGLIDANEL